MGKWWLRMMQLWAGGGTGQQLSGWCLCCCASCAACLRGVMASESQAAGGQSDCAVQAGVASQDKWWVWHRSCWGIRTLGSGRRWSHQICWANMAGLLWVWAVMPPTSSPLQRAGFAERCCQQHQQQPPPTYMEGKILSWIHGIKAWLSWVIESFWVWRIVKHMPEKGKIKTFFFFLM